MALGYQAGTPTKAAVGSIPFCSEAGGVVRYIYLYDEADSDRVLDALRVLSQEEPPLED